MDSWSTLDSRWQQAMGPALRAYLSGSAPAGAAVFAADGTLVSQGSNAFQRERLAHAEIQALNAVPQAAARSDLTLYCTMEPCPMCTGAIRMMQLRTVRFATRDPAAGSTDMLAMTPFMRHFPCAVTGPEDTLLESANVALMLEYRTRNGHRRWRDEWYSYLPSAVEVGERLAADKQFLTWQREQSSPELVYNVVCELVQQTSRNRHEQ